MLQLYLCDFIHGVTTITSSDCASAVGSLHDIAAFGSCLHEGIIVPDEIVCHITSKDIIDFMITVLAVSFPPFTP